MVVKIITSNGVSERRACVLAGISRTAVRRTSSKKTDDDDIQAITDLASKYKRLGYRMLHSIYKNKGGKMNHKRFYRLYREENLAVRKNKRKKLKRERVPLVQVERPNEKWSMDFVFDSTAIGQTVKVLTLIDDFSKECLWLEVDTGMDGLRVAQILDQVCLMYGRPKSIKSDNGPEFISKQLTMWFIKNDISHEFIEPGKPTQNAFCESFNGKFRDSCLNENLFVDLEDARRLIEEWREFYYDVRPHSSLGYMTPRKFVENFNQKLALRMDN